MDSEMIEHTFAEPLEKRKAKAKAKTKAKARILIAKGITKTKMCLRFLSRPDMTPEDYGVRRQNFRNHGRFVTKQEYKPMPIPVSIPIKKKNRFDDEYYHTNARGIKRPTSLSGEAKRRAVKFGKFAVECINQKNKKKEGEEEEGVMLEFVRPLKIKQQLVAGYNYYITLEAKDVGAPSHQSRIYQTKVYDPINKVTRVTSFRLKPPDSDSED